MKKHINPNIGAPLIRSAVYLLLLVAVCVIAFAFGQRLIGAPSQKDNPTGFVCIGCPSNGWHAGPDMPRTAVRTVGVYFYTNNHFYVMGGRSMDGVGNDFTHPFEYSGGYNGVWTIKSATYPDNQVSNMACGLLTDSGTNYIYCVGGSAGGQSTATARVFRYNPVSDTIETIASPWPGDADGITLPGGFVAFNNKLYILGGFRVNTEMIDTIWEFTPGTNTWVQKNAHLPVPLGYIPTTSIFDRIYTGGGSTWDGSTIHDSNNSFVYDPVADSISTIASIPRATGETQAFFLALLGSNNYMMWVMGGGRDVPNPSNEIDVYDHFNNSWAPEFGFITPRRNFASAGAGCNAWLAGGYASDGVTPLSSMEFFCFPAPTATVTATATPTLSPTGSPTATHTPPTPTVTATATHTPTATPTVTITVSPSPTPMPSETIPPVRTTPTPRIRPTPPPRP